MKTKEACALTYGHYIITLGPSGCNVSRDQRHVGRVVAGRLELSKDAGPMAVATIRTIEAFSFGLRNLLDLAPLNPPDES